MRRGTRILHDQLVVAASVGTVMLVVITVAMIGVVGLFAFDLVDFPEEPPTVDVVFTELNDRWSVHINDVSEEVPLSEYRLLAMHPSGEYVMYDTDGDGTTDATLIFELSDIAKSSASGPQPTPIVYLDVDGDGMMSSGDSFILQSQQLPVGSLFMDGSRGFKYVDNGPNGIPKDSELTIRASPATLTPANLQPGDNISLTIMHGSTVEAVRSGAASSSADYVTNVYIEATWHNGNHKVDFVVRGGEADEWTDQYLFKVINEVPITPEELEDYEEAKHPVRTGDLIQLVHIGANQVVLEFRL